MIDIIPLEVTSLKVIQRELAVSLEKASRYFEDFVADRWATQQLSKSEQCTSDVVGILKMLQVPGALELAEEMLEVLQTMVAQAEKVSDFSVSALSRAFVWMPYYIEYVADREQVVPSLALPFINELRAALRKSLILESELAEFQCADPIDLHSDEVEEVSDLAALVPRLRLMYQVGLTGLLREENLEIKIRLMHRSVARLARSVFDAPIRTQWRLTEAVLEGLLNGDLQLDYTRKRVLSFIERELREFEKDCDNVEITASDELLNELVYLVNLSASSDPASSEVVDRLELTQFEVTDRIFQQEKAVMQRPSAETILAMVAALQEDLGQSKAILEVAEQDAPGSVDLSSLISLFQRTTSILSIAGMQGADEILANILSKMESSADAEEDTQDILPEIADGLLYIESTLANLSRMDLDLDAADDEQTKEAVIAKSQLNEAEAIVIREAQAALASSKDDIDSFVKSNYDTLHLQSVVDTLVSVRGGVEVLKLDRAVDVLLSCEEFVQGLVENGVQGEDIDSVLETMADVLIALEYYLSEIELHGVAPPNILDVAEQSLSARN